MARSTFTALNSDECLVLYNTTSDYLILLERDLDKVNMPKGMRGYASDALDAVKVLKRKCGMERFDHRLDKQSERIAYLASGQIERWRQRAKAFMEMD